MPNITISGLSNKTTPVASDEVEIQATGGGASAKATLQNVSKALSPEADNLLSTGANHGKAPVTDGAGGVDFDTLVWKDLTGRDIARDIGATAPSLVAFQGSIRRLAFDAGNEQDWEFHMPHDWAPGTDLYLHVHWGHNGTAISGNMVFTCNVSYAKGHDQANFSAEISPTITYNTVDIATTPQYRHRIDEIQLSAAAPSATQLDTDDLEVDGLIFVNIEATTIPTITGGSPNEPFLFTLDLHYQANYIGTLNKAPNFYV